MPITHIIWIIVGIICTIFTDRNGGFPNKVPQSYIADSSVDLKPYLDTNYIPDKRTLPKDVVEIPKEELAIKRECLVIDIFQILLYGNRSEYPNCEVILKEIPDSILQFSENDPALRIQVLSWLNTLLSEEIESLLSAYNPGGTYDSKPTGEKMKRNMLSISGALSSLADMLKFQSRPNRPRSKPHLPSIGRHPTFGSKTGSFGMNRSRGFKQKLLFKGR